VRLGAACGCVAQEGALNVWYIVPSATLSISLMLICICGTGAVYAFCVTNEVIVCRALRLIIVLKAIVMFGIFPFITFLALYQVNIVNNIFIIVTVPNMLQFSFGVLYSCYTDIVPIFQNTKNLHPAILVTRVVLLFLPIALIFGLSVLAGVLWTDPAPVDFTDSNGTLIPRSKSAANASFAFTILGTALLGGIVITTCALGAAFSTQISNMGQYVYETAAGLNSKEKSLKESAEAKLRARGQIVEGDEEAGED
jgi:hypothetical protein